MLGINVKNWFYKLPLRQVFLLDAIGAALSIVVLFFVVENWQPLFGITQNAIHLLAIIACCYFLYSISCYLFLRKRLVSFLKVIAILNILYAVFILLLLFIEYSHLTVVGVMYMIGDAVIVFSLGVLEFLTANAKMNIE